MKYAYINEDSREIIGWFDSDIHDTIPTPNVSITDGNWNNAISKGHNYIDEDGITSFVDFRTQEEKDFQDKEIANVEPKRYLADTDWYVVRKYETGKDIPQEILDARAEARDKIVD